MYDSATSSCHRVNSDPISPSSFDNFHNTPKKLSDRQLMLNGDWPSGGCEYCQKIEDAGGSSDRMFHLQIPDMAPPELEFDVNAVNVTPRILEVYFDNICNMSCLYCWDGFSSKIQKENLDFGRFEKNGVVIDNRAIKTPDKKQLEQALWKWMKHNAITLKRFHVLGGEPFFQPQFDDCLDFFDENPCPELEFNVISNIKIHPDRLDKIISRIRSLEVRQHIKRFDLTVSIDCFGAEQEYVRYGIDLEQWKTNFSKLCNESWITLNINQTLSGLTIKTIPELLKWLDPIRESREIGHYFSTVVLTHDFLHPGIFGPGFYSEDFDTILNLMPEHTWQQKQAKIYMEGIKAQIDNCPRNTDKIKQLGIFLDEIDRRRSLNWRIVFPWLDQEIKNVV